MAKTNTQTQLRCFEKSRPVAVMVGPSIAGEALTRQLGKIFYGPIQMKGGTYRTALIFDAAPHIVRLKFEAMARWVLKNYVTKEELSAVEFRAKTSMIYVCAEEILSVSHDSSLALEILKSAGIRLSNPRDMRVLHAQGEETERMIRRLLKKGGRS
jgi:hypothetical protein